MKVLVLSDTHSQMRNIWGSWSDEDKRSSLDCDLIVHAGDLTLRGSKDEVESELKSLNDIFDQEKVIISGNHDFFLDTDWKSYTSIGKKRHGNNRFGTLEEISELMDKLNINYLNDSFIEIKGLKIWGSPVTPWFNDWAFNRERGKDIIAHWNKIPEELDILITHGPPKGILDLVKYPMIGESPNVGCGDLLYSVFSKMPKYHIFGHIHEGRGIMESNGITFINASCIDESHNPINKPIIINI